MRLLDDVTQEPLRIERDGVLFQIRCIEQDDISYEPNAEHVVKMLHKTTGTWADFNIDQMIEDVYEARRAGSRSLNRP